MLDFEWACHETLRYFKLAAPIELKAKTMTVIVKRLALMPYLIKLKLDQIWST